MDIAIYRNSKTILDVELSKNSILKTFNPVNIPNSIYKYDSDLTNVKEFIQHINENEIIKKIKKQPTYRKLVRTVGYKNAKRLIKIGLAALLFITTTGINVLADEQIAQAASNIDVKMGEVFILIAIIGGWLLVAAAIIEIGTCLAKGSNENLLGIVVKYVLIYIAMLLMPTIIKWTRNLVLGW